MYVEEDQVLFAGDAMMPIPTIVDGDPDVLKETLRKFQALEPESIVQGHGEVILRGEVQDALRANIAYLETIQRIVTEAVAGDFFGWAHGIAGLAMIAGGWTSDIIGLVVVLVVVALVVPILVLARKIGNEADVINTSLKESVENTAALSDLASTNTMAINVIEGLKRGRQRLGG